MSAKATFGTLKKNMNQSDYLNKKKGVCKQRCNNNNDTYFSMNKYNLIIGQYSKMNLNDITTVENTTATPVIINPSDINPFYYTNTIDPYGQLFGKSECGSLNYVRYITPDH